MCSRKCLREEHCARGAVNEFRELFLLRLCWWLQPSSETVSSRGGMIKVELMLFSILRDCRNDHWILFLSNFPLCASGLTCGMNFLYCDCEASVRGVVAGGLQNPARCIHVVSFCKNSSAAARDDQEGALRVGKSIASYLFSGISPSREHSPGSHGGIRSRR